MNIRKDITGLVVRYLTVIRPAYNKRHQNFWECLCKCGKTTYVPTSKLISGETGSCGCYQREKATIDSTTHGLCGHPLWRKWRDILNRCYRKTVESYPLYGGNGVEVCKEWREDFMSFYNWCINNGWKPELQLDKDIIPKKLGIPPKLYGPHVCCFVTPKENNNNRKSNVFIEMDGVTKTIAQWSELYSMNQGLVGARIRRGWPLIKALTIDNKLTGKRKC